MRRVVKFGGTSVFHLERVVDIVREYRQDGLCVVVSAVQNTTSLLMQGNIDAVRKLYLNWAKELNINHTIHMFWDHVETVLSMGVGNIDARRDLVLSYGERFTAFVVDLAINRLVGPSIFFDNIRVSGFFGDAAIVDICLHTPDPGVVMVTPGFYGYDGHSVKTIGKSGSDITAGAMAKVLDVDEIIIYTDVDGIYNADPRRLPNATVIRHMRRCDAIELGYAGGNVLHPRTTIQLLDTDIVLWVRNVMGNDGDGTKISIDGDPCLAVSLLNDQIMVTVKSPHMNSIPGVASELFDTLAIRGISVSLITQSCSECSIGFTIAEKHIDTLCLVNDVSEIRKVGIVTLVGSDMKMQVGLAASVFTAIASAGINVIAISQGSTESSISIVVSRNNSYQALESVHEILS